jgi:hypothetical protein
VLRVFSNRLGVQQGSEMLFSDFADGGVMWTGQGPREKRVRIAFATGFVSAPAVTVGISMWDIDHRSNSRVDLMAEKIGLEGFDLVFRTWGDTRIARIRADWTAIGPVSDDDAWDVE